MNPKLQLVIILILSPTPILLYWWLRARRRKRERMGLVDTTVRAKRQDINEFVPRTLIAKFVGTFGGLFWAAGIGAVIDKPAEWKVAAGMVAFGMVLVAFAVSLIKGEATPLAVHLNRAVFLIYALFFVAMLWHLRNYNLKPAYLIVLRIIATVLFVLAIGGMACSFSRAAPARWVLAAIQIAIAAFWVFIILRSRGPALWGHPIAVGCWAGITLLLVISLFGKQANAYYSIPIQNRIEQTNQRTT